MNVRLYAYYHYICFAIFLFVVREWNLPSSVLRFWGNGIAYSEHDVYIDEPREYKRLPSLGTLVVIVTNKQNRYVILKRSPYQNNTAQTIFAKAKFLV